ncbi:MAG: radical SAM protein [Nitrospiraceae bacterium]|nr:radical SAM protein [Nitrospiraceae bacterium]
MDKPYPKFIQFFPTLRCNSSCSFCFNRGIGINEEINKANYKKIIDKLADAGINEIDILGGEPTLHPEIIQLIDIPIKRNMHVFLSSNGSNIDILELLLQKYNKNTLTLGISVNSKKISNELHNFIVKNKPILKGICTAEKTIPDAAVDYVKSGIPYFILFMDAITKKELKETIPFYEFLQKLNTLKDKYKNVDGVYCSGFVSKDRHETRCPAGTVKLSVLPDGSVFPCYLLARNEKFRFGNILEDSFDTLMKNPCLDFFKGMKKNSCPKKECKVFNSCNGGCPAISLLIYNDINAPDPRCNLTYESVYE